MSLGAQCGDRIDANRAQGGQKTRPYRDRTEQKNDAQQGHGVSDADAVHQALEKAPSP